MLFGYREDEKLWGLFVMEKVLVSISCFCFFDIVMVKVRVGFRIVLKVFECVGGYFYFW